MAKRAPYRRIAITGASSGLGAALALAYSEPGVSLGLIGRNEARLATTATACREAGAQVVVARLDVGEPTSLGSWLCAFDQESPIDVLLANAGISGGPAPRSAAEGLEVASSQVRVNLLGVINTVEPLLPAFVQRRFGQIGIVASLAAYRGLPYSPGYCAAKAGARAYGEALRALLAPAGVGVSVICPGFFSSPMSDRFMGPKPFKISAEWAALIVKRGLARRRRRIVFPWQLAIGLRLADLMPPLMGDSILRAFSFHIVSS